MSLSNSEAITLRRQLTGRRVFALNRTRERVDPVREPGLLERIDRAIAWDRQTIQLERRWDKTKASTSRGRGEAVRIDNQLDRGISAFNQVLDGHINGPASEKAKAADRIKTSVFPLGVAAITRLAYEQQHTMVASILEELRHSLAADVKLLGLEEHVDHIARLNDALEAELAKQPNQLNYADVTAAQGFGQDLYSGIALAIFGRYSDPEDEKARTRRDELLAEIYRQDQLLREYYKRNRGAVDVDPDTGEPHEPLPELPAADEPAA